MKFKVGDRVKVIDCDVQGKKCQNLNKVCTITKIDERNGDHPYILENLKEHFGDRELELVGTRKFTKSDLKDGDKCILKNGRIVFFNKDKYYKSIYCFNNLNNNFSYYNDDVSIVKIERPVQYETVFERKEEILDETEKRYLKSVIRPFRDRTIYISKIKKYSEEQIIMCIDGYYDFFKMPVFKANTMYKGMKLDEKYTLKELGL